MATPGVPTPSPLQPSENAPKQNRILNFRVDDDLLEGVDAFAAEMNVERSVACRHLLSASLGNPPKLQAIREAVFTIAKNRRRLIGKLMLTMAEQIKVLMEEELESAVEEDGADVGEPA